MFFFNFSAANKAKHPYPAWEGVKWTIMYSFIIVRHLHET